jgi:hypothetical protein
MSPRCSRSSGLQNNELQRTRPGFAWSLAAELSVRWTHRKATVTEWSKVWRSAQGAQPGASHQLAPLVTSLCEEIERRPTDLVALKAALEGVLRFLSSAEGRNDANCRAVDWFFGPAVSYDWERKCEHLPEAIRQVLGDMGGALHDTVESPEIAATFGSTPEQLLERVRGVEG